MGAERLILALARRQQGTVAARQLVSAGVSRDVVRHRVSIGWLVRMHRGVYLVGPLRTPFTESMAAVLAVGDGALRSHYPAAVWRAEQLVVEVDGYAFHSSRSSSSETGAGTPTWRPKGSA